MVSVSRFHEVGKDDPPKVRAIDRSVELVHSASFYSSGVRTVYHQSTGTHSASLTSPDQ